MRLAIIGRTKMLLDAANEAMRAGHQIVFVATAKQSAESTAGPEDFRKLADLVGSPFFVGARFSETEINLIRKLAPDLGLTMNWPTMIHEEVTQSFQHGIINAHGSDLPKYRGNACPNWAILNGDNRIGLTFHVIDPNGLDTGPVVHKTFLEIDDDDYIGDVYEWLDAAVPKGFIDSIALILDGHSPCPQIGDIVRSYPRRPEDGRIDWTQQSAQIHRLIRATSRPFPGAFSFFSGRKVLVWRAKRIDVPFSILAVPGQVLWYEGKQPVVACGRGALQLEYIQSDDGNDLDRSLRSRFT